MESQHTFSLNSFMDCLCKEYTDVAKVLIYYDSKAILQRKRMSRRDFVGEVEHRWTNVYFHPLHIIIIKKDNKKINLNKAAIDNEYGEYFGIHFALNSRHYILKAHQINMVEVLASKESYNDSEYYPSRTILYQSHIPLLDKLHTKYPDNPVFSFYPGITSEDKFADDINEDEDFDDEILDSV